MGPRGGGGEPLMHSIRVIFLCSKDTLVAIDGLGSCPKGAIAHARLIVHLLLPTQCKQI